MILVTLGTQDKQFTRLLKAIDNAIDKGIIKDKVIVQAGSTKYSSDNMEIFDLISSSKFSEMIKSCDLLITHGGVGSILEGLKYNKKVIAAARLKKYDEHENDHQKQVIREFVKERYILELKNFNKIEDVLKDVKKFKPKEYKSHTKEFIKTLDDYILDDNHISWYNKYKILFNVILLLLIVLIIFLIAK